MVREESVLTEKEVVDRSKAERSSQIRNENLHEI